MRNTNWRDRWCLMRFSIHRTALARDPKPPHQFVSSPSQVQKDFKKPHLDRPHFTIPHVTGTTSRFSGLGWLRSSPCKTVAKHICLSLTAASLRLVESIKRSITGCWQHSTCIGSGTSLFAEHLRKHFGVPRKNKVRPFQGQMSLTLALRLFFQVYFPSTPKTPTQQRDVLPAVTNLSLASRRLMFRAYFGIAVWEAPECVPAHPAVRKGKDMSCQEKLGRHDDELSVSYCWPTGRSSSLQIRIIQKGPAMSSSDHKSTAV
ncbi:uncharacterized protein FOMMEDRAFT_161868 [Fomitiporia mediterranea MF3/22]|uniref:uncharacterized protein n=1 Tax=Fomitiporia mediterranea (strain MF3/22) TaxID=694068 RepID=UPI0004408883|nr:uncharacterized protein FOMMEDRAFT_161868 [Fomitiporia mediterranea MF3/22]EJC98491.1 hypothetical protein FOMMEDRAFT_161868 [Fomitiporia mediterranea MF3/22]